MLIDVAAARTRSLAVLRQCFPALERAALEHVADRFLWVQVSGGDTLLCQGEAATCMYLVVSGRLRAYVTRPDGSDAVAGDVGACEAVGEVALLTGEPHSETIRATRDSELLMIGRPEFERLLADHPGVMKQIACTNLVKLQRSILDPAVDRRVATIAVTPAGVDAPLGHVAASLVRALSAFGPTLHVDRLAFERGIGEASARNACGARAAAWLNEQEGRYRYVVYEADRAVTPWTRCCLRQADLVLGAGVAAGDPRLGEVEAEVQASASVSGVPRHLVLLHPDDVGRPSGTEKWLAPRHQTAHHHVRLQSDEDHARLARILTGRAVGLVLGGGGSRGLAHIGALRAIEELGIPIDFVGGTSSGAVVAGAVATGHTWQDMLQIARERLAGSRSLLDFTVPFVSMVSGRRISTWLHGMFDDARIEDLWVNFFCVSTNLSRARMVVHRDGSLWKSIRASVSLPGILPPMLHERDLLVDGGVMNKLPVDVMRGLCNGGKVLAVSVTPTDEGPAGGDPFGEHLSGWSILRRRLNPFAPRRQGPNIADILLCSTLVKSAQTQQSLERQADACVRVPAPRVGLFDFRSLDAIVEGGYRAAGEQLGGWAAAPRAACSVTTHAPAEIHALA